MREAQRLAALAVSRVLEGRSLPEELRLLIEAAPGLGAQRRAAAQDLAYGTLRFLGTLRAVLDGLLRAPPRDPRIQCLLLVALYQLQYRESPPHAVVSQAVAAAESLNAHAPKALVNGVLRNFLRRRAVLLSAAADTPEGRYSHPAWWVERLRREYPVCYGEILDQGNRHPPMTLRVNRRRRARDDYQALLVDHGMEARPLGDAGLILAKPVPVERLPGFREGLVSVQDFGAQLAAGLLQLEDGQRVLDACAAPGGKTAHILECAAVECVAVDADPARLAKVQDNLLRLGLGATLLPGDAASPELWWDGKPFHRVLADVPCSSSGVVRRHPDIKWLRRERDIPRYVEQQQAILDGLWRTLATDGKLLYATCSVFPEENRLQVASFLDRHPDAQRLSLDAAAETDGQLLPGPTHDGFFYALLGKRAA